MNNYKNIEDEHFSHCNTTKELLGFNVQSSQEFVPYILELLQDIHSIQTGKKSSEILEKSLDFLNACLTQSSNTLPDFFFQDTQILNIHLSLLNVENPTILSKVIKNITALYIKNPNQFTNICSMLIIFRKLFQTRHPVLMDPILYFYACFCDRNPVHINTLFSLDPENKIPFFSIESLKTIVLDDDIYDDIFDQILVFLYSISSNVPNLFNAHLITYLVRIIWHKRYTSLPTFSGYDYGIWVLADLINHFDEIVPYIYDIDSFISPEEDHSYFSQPTLIDHISFLLEMQEPFNIRGAAYFIGLTFNHMKIENIQPDLNPDFNKTILNINNLPFIILINTLEESQDPLAIATLSWAISQIIFFSKPKIPFSDDEIFKLTTIFLRNITDGSFSIIEETSRPLLYTLINHTPHSNFKKFVENHQLIPSLIKIIQACSSTSIVNDVFNLMIFIYEISSNEGWTELFIYELDNHEAFNLDSYLEDLEDDEIIKNYHNLIATLQLPQ